MPGSCVRIREGWASARERLSRALATTTGRIASNSGWLLSDRLIRMAGAVAVSVVLARCLGPEALGLYSYSANLVGLALPVVALGLDDIVTKQLVQNPSAAGEILGTTMVLRALAGVVGAIAVYAAAARLQAASPLVAAVATILGLTLVLQAVESPQLWFRATMNQKHAAISRDIAFLATSIGKVVAVLRGAGIGTIAIFSVGEAALGAALLLRVFARMSRIRLADLVATRGRASALLSESWPLILSAVSITIYMKIDAIMLGQMVGARWVGIYSCATRLSEVWYCVPVIVCSAASAPLMEARLKDEALFYARLQRLFDVSSAAAVAVALGMTALSRPLVIAIFGPAYSDAAAVLSVHVWAGCFVFLGVARQVWIVAEGHTRAAMVTTFIGAVTNVALNLALIPRYAAMGAAVATVVSYGISDYVLFFAYRPFRRIALMMTAALTFRSLVAGRSRDGASGKAFE